MTYTERSGCGTLTQSDVDRTVQLAEAGLLEAVGVGWVNGKKVVKFIPSSWWL